MLRLHSTALALLPLLAALALAQSITSSQEPFPGFSQFPRCSLSQSAPNILNTFFGHCVNPFTGELETWGPAAPANPGTGSYYSVAAGQGQFGEWACGISRATWGVECWGTNLFAAVSQPQIRAWRIVGGNDHVCALTFDPELFDPSHLTMKNPTGHVEFWQSFGVFCWGFENVGGSGGSNINFPFINDPANDDPVVGITAGDTSTCINTAKGSISCGGTFFDPVIGGVDVNDFVPQGVSFLTLAAGDGYYCGADSTSSVTCFGDECRSNPALCAPPAGSFKLTPSAIAPSATSACSLDESGAVVCWVNPTTLPPAGVVYTEIYVDQDVYCAVRESDNSLDCFGTGDSASAVFSPPDGVYQLGCEPTDPSVVNGISVISTVTNPYVCQIDGQYINARFDWVVESQCICFAASIESAYIIGGNVETCGLTANTFQPKPINPSDPNCIA